jgi:hypothetical protein
MTARGRRGVAGVQAARGTVRGTHMHRIQGLGRGARPNGRRPASAFMYGSMPTWPGVGHTRDVVRGGALPVLQFSIALFDHRLLKISKQNWTKRSIAKL